MIALLGAGLPALGSIGSWSSLAASRDASWWLLALAAAAALLALVGTVVLVLYLWWPSLQKRSRSNNPPASQPQVYMPLSGTGGAGNVPPTVPPSHPPPPVGQGRSPVAGMYPKQGYPAPAPYQSSTGSPAPPWPEQAQGMDMSTLYRAPVHPSSPPPSSAVAMRYTPQVNLGGPAGPPSAFLQHLQGGQPGWQVPVHRDQFTIGRADGNDLQLLDMTVSRQHIKLRYAQGAWFIQDLGSRTGANVNGQAVQAARLNYGDRISIGTSTFVFYTYMG